MPVTLQASLMMLLALFLFTTMGICIRLSSAFVPVIEVVFFRNFLAVLIMAPVLIRKGLPSIRMNRKRLFFGRASINFIGMLSGFTAVTLIPLAEMTALSFTGPIFVTMGAALFLGEAIRIRRIMAIAVGFVGALIILRPGLVDVSLGAIGGCIASGDDRRHQVGHDQRPAEMHRRIRRHRIEHGPVTKMEMPVIGTCDGKSVGHRAPPAGAGSPGTIALVASIPVQI